MRIRPTAFTFGLIIYFFTALFYDYTNTGSTQIMENIIYNELIIRGFSVDVGVVYANEKNLKGSYTKTAKEIDFVASKGSKKVYIQSALALPDEAKTEQELRPFSLTGDSFPKIIVRRDIRKKWYDDNGVLNIGLSEFLLDEDSI